MIEAVGRRAEPKRFPIAFESMSLMKRLRESFWEMNTQYPYLSGLGFFGSRTRGQEHGGSDIDLVIFYDSSKFPKKTAPLENPYFVIETFKGRLVQSGKGIRVDMMEADINNEITEGYIKKFVRSTDAHLLDKVLRQILGIDPRTDLKITLSQNVLVGRFFLAVGDDVYRSRRFILDRLKATPDGDKYWQILMGALAKIEGDLRRKRASVRYLRYPKTIKEAERYFLTRPLQASIMPEADEQRLEEDLGVQGMIGNFVRHVVPNF